MIKWKIQKYAQKINIDMRFLEFEGNSLLYSKKKVHCHCEYSTNSKTQECGLKNVD